MLVKHISHVVRLVWRSTLTCALEILVWARDEIEFITTVTASQKRRYLVDDN